MDSKHVNLKLIEHLKWHCNEIKKERNRIIQSFEIIDRNRNDFKQTEKKTANEIEIWKFAITSAKLAKQSFFYLF